MIFSNILVIFSKFLVILTEKFELSQVFGEFPGDISPVDSYFLIFYTPENFIRVEILILGDSLFILLSWRDYNLIVLKNN